MTKDRLGEMAGISLDLVQDFTSFVDFLLIKAQLKGFVNNFTPAIKQQKSRILHGH